MAGKLDPKRSANATSTGLLAAYRGQYGTQVTQASIRVAYRLPPSTAVRATQTPLLFTYRLPAPRSARLTQTALLAAVTAQGNLKVRVTQAAMMMAYKTGVPGQARQRAWTFDLDGHSFYVLDLAKEGTWVYDMTTDQWSKFETPGYGVWNMLNGFFWESNRMIVAGDSIQPRVNVINPASALDDGWRPVKYIVTGGISLGIKDGESVDSLRLSVSSGYIGDTTLGLSTIILNYSDDNGVTYSADLPYQLQSAVYNQRVEWNGLGTMNIPGRVFNFTDSGGLLRINAATIRIDGKE